ncbi:MAG: tetratricopeptide repeat protein [Chloroflexi bacterium]|nr:MAG: tetratricopeptide repeat protein [Chloroflexota bacterium]
MPTISLKQYLENVDTLLQSGSSDLNEVIHHCRHILKYYPRNIAAYRYMGQALMLNANWDQAAEVYRSVLSVIPDDFTAHAQLGEIYQRTNQPDRAVWHYERAFEQDPHADNVINALRELYRQHLGVASPRVQLTAGGLARQYSRNGLPDRAIATLRDALEQSPNRTDLRLLLAQTLWDAGYRIEAAEAAMDVLQSLPDCLEANRIMTRLWLDEGRPSDAQRYLNRVEAVDPYLALSLVQAGAIPDDAFQLEELNYQEVAQRQMVTGDLPWLQEIGDIEDTGGADETANMPNTPDIVSDDEWMDVFDESAAPVDDVPSFDDTFDLPADFSEAGDGFDLPADLPDAGDGFDLPDAGDEFDLPADLSDAGDVSDIAEPDWMTGIDDILDETTGSMKPITEADFPVDELPDSGWLNDFDDENAAPVDDMQFSQDAGDTFAQQTASEFADDTGFDFPADEDDSLAWMTGDDSQQPATEATEDEALEWLTTEDDAQTSATTPQDFSPHDNEDPLAWASDNIEFVEGAENITRREVNAVEDASELNFEVPDTGDSLAWLQDADVEITDDAPSMPEDAQPIEDALATDEETDEEDELERDSLAWMQGTGIELTGDLHPPSFEEQPIDDELPLPAEDEHIPAQEQAIASAPPAAQDFSDYEDDALDVLELAEAFDEDDSAMPAATFAPAEDAANNDDEIMDDDEFLDDEMIDAMTTGEMAQMAEASTDDMTPAEAVDDTPSSDATFATATASEMASENVEATVGRIDDDYDWLDDGTGYDADTFSPQATDASTDMIDDVPAQTPDDIPDWLEQPATTANDGIQWSSDVQSLAQQASESRIPDAAESSVAAQHEEDTRAAWIDQPSYPDVEPSEAAADEEDSVPDWVEQPAATHEEDTRAAWIDQPSYPDVEAIDAITDAEADSDDWLSTIADDEASPEQFDTAAEEAIVASAEADSDDWLSTIADDETDDTMGAFEVGGDWSEAVLEEDSSVAASEVDADWLSQVELDTDEELATEPGDSIAASTDFNNDDALSEGVAVTNTHDADDGSFDWLNEITDNTEDARQALEDTDWMAEMSLDPDEDAAMAALPTDDEQDDGDTGDDFDWGDTDDTVDSGVTDRPSWLEELEQGNGGDDAGHIADAADDSGGDWMSEIEADTGDYQDKTPQTNEFPQPTGSKGTKILSMPEDTNEATEPLSEAMDAPSEDAAPDVYSPATTADYLSENDDSSWLNELEAQGTFNDSDEFATQADAIDDDWLSGITAAQSESTAFEVDDGGDSSEFDWLQDISDSDADHEVESAPEISVEEALDWMSDEPELDEEAAIDFDTLASMSNADEETSLTPADNAPDWLNAMVPGLDLDYEASEDAPIEQEYIEEVEAEAPINLLDEEPPVEGSTEEFDWLLNVIDEETGPQRSVDTTAKQYRFVFEKDPAWLQQAHQKAEQAPPAIKPLRVDTIDTSRDDDSPDFDDDLNFDDALDIDDDLNFDDALDIDDDLNFDDALDIDDDLNFDDALDDLDFDVDEAAQSDTVENAATTSSTSDDFTDLDDLPDWLRDTDDSAETDEATNQSSEDDFDDLDLPDWLT